MDTPNRQATWRRHGSSLRAGWVLALMTLATAPTPCSRTGFHISNNSWWIAGTAGAVLVARIAGSMISISPGLARSISAWMLAVATTWIGVLPPIVTVTVLT